MSQKIILTPDEKEKLSTKIQKNLFKLYKKHGMIETGFSTIYEIAYIANKIVRSVSCNDSG